jgi:hypothetical protein
VKPRVVFAWVLVTVAASGCEWWDSPERRIRRVLEGIADRLSHEAPLTGLAAAAAAAGLQEYLSPDVVIETDAPVLRLTGRDAAVGAAARLVISTPFLRVQFVDVQVTFGGAGQDRDRAEVACNVTVATQDRAGQHTADARELNLSMRQVEDRWVVERVKAVNVLEPVS